MEKTEHSKSTLALQKLTFWSEINAYTSLSEMEPYGKYGDICIGHTYDR